MVIDLAGVTCCSLEGVALLLAAAATASGAQLRLAGAGPQLARLLECTGAARLLALYPTVADALGGGDPAPVPAQSPAGS